MGETPPSTPKSSFLSGQKASEPFLKGAETEQSARCMGKRGPPLAYMIYNFVMDLFQTCTFSSF